MFFAGMAQGFSDAQTKDRQLQAQIDEQNATRDQQTLLHIATTHPDDQVRASALSAMMTPRQPPGGYFKTLFNAAKTNPMMPTLTALMQGTKGVQQTAPGTPGPGLMPEDQGAAATPPPSGMPGGPGSPETGPESQPMSMAMVHNILPQAAAGAPLQTTVQVPRGAPPTTAQVAGQTEEEQKAGGIRGVIKAANEPPPAGGTGMDPDTRDLVIGRQLGLSPTVSYDQQGNRHEFIGNKEVGAPSMGVGKPSAGFANIEQQAHNLMAADPSLSASEALQRAEAAAGATTAATQSATASRATTAAAGAAVAGPMATARLAGAQQTVQTQEARMESMRASAAATWQRVNGTTPMTHAQSLQGARELVGDDPTIQSADMGRLADSIWASTQPGAAGRAPAATSGGAPAPVATPPPGAAGGAPPAPAAAIGGSAARPAAATPPPGPKGAQGSVQGAVQGAGLAGATPNFKSYSEAGKQTVQSVQVLNALLPKIAASIQQAGLANQTSPLTPEIQKTLYSLGFAQTDTIEQILQREGMAEGYGLRGLLGGRTNQPLQKIMGMHLVSPGDSGKLVLQKIATLQQSIPDILSAVDKAESMRVGGGAGQGQTAAGPPGGTVQVKDPTGGVHTFQSQADANAFKQAAGIP